MQVASNGVLTFRAGLGPDTINHFALAVNSCNNGTGLCPIIAPFWQEDATFEDSEVYYRVTVENPAAQDGIIFLHEIRQTCSDFTPTLQVVVTWFRPNVTGRGLVSNMRVL